MVVVSVIQFLKMICQLLSAKTLAKEQWRKLHGLSLCSDSGELTETYGACMMINPVYLEKPFAVMDDDEINYSLPLFLTEVLKKDGSELVDQYIDGPAPFILAVHPCR